MKKVKLFSFALAALMLGACSSEDGIDNGGQGTVLPGEKGYISLAINLPTTPSTRANDNFDDGLPVEYAVNNATLLIFEGTDEASAKFAGGYDLGTITPNTVGGNITSTFKVTKEIKKPVNGDLYALVVVNRGDVLTTEDQGATWKLNGTELSALTTLSAFNATAQEIAAEKLYDTTDDGNGFFMTNAPLYSVPGGTVQPSNGDLSTLTLINAENVYTTAAEAEANPAASVYVERAVAKVTVNGTNGNLGNNAGMTYTISGWTFDVTNKKTYLVRNMTDANTWWNYNVAGDYRFVGSAAVGPNLYRTYWGVDPNYSSYIAGDFNIFAGQTPADLNPVNGNGYCLENTFDVDNQNQNQTTRVIVAATLNAGSTFYILDNDKGKIWSKTEAEDAVKAEYLGNQAVIAALTANLDGADKKITGDDLTVTFDKAAGDLTVTMIEISADKAGDFKGGEIPDALTPGTEANNAILAAVNAGKKVSCYANGVAYYPVMIRHFDDNQTPWSNVEYGGNENNFLGRYGVLRNNWYEINVTGIKDIGYADVPDVYGTPDDPMESYISVEINVLSWAKRSQNVEL
jgi:hypothetical protein